MEKVHVQKKKKNNKHKQMQNSQIFWVLKQYFHVLSFARNKSFLEQQQQQQQ